MLDLIIKNGSCYIDKDLKDQDIAIKDGKIIKIGKIDEEAKEEFEAKNLTILLNEKEEDCINNCIQLWIYFDINKFLPFKNGGTLAFSRAEENAPYTAHLQR